MLKIKIMVIDRTKAAFLKQGEDFYKERLKHYTSLEWVELKPVKILKKKTDIEIMAAEAQIIRKSLQPRDYLIALDRSGESPGSAELAEWLRRLSLNSQGTITFLIGGPLGLDQELLGQARKIFSLSKLTLTHEMSRLILLEQLYRAFTILKGEKYHK
jgi:23S rRNA (pseudouridine1915-N3)-methyltransferase